MWPSAETPDGAGSRCGVEVFVPPGRQRSCWCSRADLEIDWILLLLVVLPQVVLRPPRFTGVDSQKLCGHSGLPRRVFAAFEAQMSQDFLSGVVPAPGVHKVGESPGSAPPDLSFQPGTSQGTRWGFQWILWSFNQQISSTAGVSWEYSRL